MKDILVWLIIIAAFLGVMAIVAALGGGYDDDWSDHDDASRCN